MSLADAAMVVHGPEVIDSGRLAWLVSRCRPARIVIAGIMARAAAEESGLPVEFAGEPPSRVIPRVGKPVYLVTQGRTVDSGLAFGEIVASRLEGCSLLHVECTAGLVVLWNTAASNLSAELSRATGYPEHPLPVRVAEDGKVRKIRGCIPGEPVFVNGIVIGRATAGMVVLSCEGGVPVPVSGLNPKPHGIEKLALARDFDPESAWCKSGPIRAARPAVVTRQAAPGRILVLDHCAHEIFRHISPETCGILAIGDDTTAACGHICAHRGIPVLGITDRDGDGIVPPGYSPGSVVVEVLSGRDDDLGREVAGMVPGHPVRWEDWVEKVLATLGPRIRRIYPEEPESRDPR